MVSSGVYLLLKCGLVAFFASVGASPWTARIAASRPSFVFAHCCTLRVRAGPHRVKVPARLGRLVVMQCRLHDPERLVHARTVHLSQRRVTEIQGRVLDELERLLTGSGEVRVRLRAGEGLACCDPADRAEDAERDGVG
jgi:hypothetical protein